MNDLQDSRLRGNSSAYKVGVIGGGAWGTALAILANRAGSRVQIYTRNRNVIAQIQEKRMNDAYLPGVYISPEISVTDSAKDVCDADMLVIATPTNYVRSVCISISDQLHAGTLLLVASKGIERGSLMLMSEVVRSVLPGNPIAIVSGPNFADEAARGLPTATTIACEDKSQWDLLTYAIGGKLFRPYLTDDIIGAQVGGAIKNVIAIACGIAHGRGMGENAAAAIITRGFSEMTRLALARGARYETMAGLAGLGDLLLTCGSKKSRNMSFGIAVGQGKSVKELLELRGRTSTEGVIAAESVTKVARKYEVEMPICHAVYRILYEQATVDEVMQTLLERPFSRDGI
ncbi:MAG: NAD(P)H-dependent glycerol-3-phosphate dehydrogenase [Alphaproteobacteria bacterium]|nr:NAD(P)H-dependent glycerol-3-phosphate dehydrogenase [Alphaproteobacteria bacterium]